MAASMVMKSFGLISPIIRKNISSEVRAFSDLCKCGTKQSPINICTAETEPTRKPALRFDWGCGVQLCMTLVGNNIQIKAISSSPLTLEGGVLCGKYIFDQINLKWGECSSNGSEHGLNRERFGMEAQFVYYNCKFQCAADALRQQDGIAILGVFLFASENEHCDFNEVVKKLPQIQRCRGEPIGLERNILPMFKDVLQKQYFSYEGSLTVPPCCETIRWLVFKEGICVGKKQISAFRELCGQEGQIAKNNRDIQESNCRKILCVTPMAC